MLYVLTAVLGAKHWHSCFKLQKVTFELRVSVESSTAPLACGNVRFTNTIGPESTVSLERQTDMSNDIFTHTHGSDRMVR